MSDTQEAERKSKLLAHIKGVVTKTLVLYIVLTILTSLMVSGMALKARDMDSMTFVKSYHDTTFKLGTHQKMYDSNGKEYILATFNSEYGSIQCSIPISLEDKLESDVGYEAEIETQSLQTNRNTNDSSSINELAKSSYSYISDVKFLFTEYINDYEVDQEALKVKIANISKSILESNSDRVFSQADEIRVNYLIAAKMVVADSLSSVITIITYSVLIYIVIRILMSSLVEVNVTVQKK